MYTILVSPTSCHQHAGDPDAQTTSVAAVAQRGAVTADQCSFTLLADDSISSDLFDPHQETTSLSTTFQMSERLPAFEANFSASAPGRSILRSRSGRFGSSTQHNGGMILLRCLPYAFWPDDPKEISASSEQPTR